MQWNENAFRALTRSGYVQGVVTKVANEVADDLRQNAPKDTLEYVNSISVATKFQDRAVALVVVADDKAMILESKSAPMVQALNRAKRRHRGG